MVCVSVFCRKFFLVLQFSTCFLSPFMIFSKQSYKDLNHFSMQQNSSHSNNKRHFKKPLDLLSLHKYKCIKTLCSCSAHLLIKCRFFSNLFKNLSICFNYVSVQTTYGPCETNYAYGAAVKFSATNFIQYFTF